MLNTDARLNEDLEAADQNPHYVRSVTETGDQQEVVAQEDIYAANGMKLLAKGARIDRSKLAKLTEHRLTRPIDLMLVAASTMDQKALAAEADRQMAADPLLSRMAARCGDPLGFKFTLGRLAFPHAVAFRLTVMHASRPALFAHSLRTAMIAHFIGTRLALGEQQMDDLLLACLCHDLGEMHTDPDLLESSQRIDGENRRFIHVHPITSYVVLQELKAGSPEMLQAVLQHHERLDGSGYPYGLSGAKIGSLARVMAVAETLEAVTRRFDLARLDVILRLNHRRLDQAAEAALRDLLKGEVHGTELKGDDREIAHRLLRLSAVLRNWSGLSERVKGDGGNAPLHFLVDRMSMLYSLSVQAGVYPESATVLDLATHDAGVLDELLATLGEIERLLDEFAFEIERRTESHVQCKDLAQELVQLMRS